MKRRDFLAAAAAAAALTLSSSAAAAPKKPAQAQPKVSAKAKTSKASKASSAKKSAKSSTKPSPQPRANAAQSAETLSTETASDNLASAAAQPKQDTRNALSLPEEPLAAWRYYEIRSTIQLNEMRGKTRLWLPLVQYRDTPWMRSFGHQWQGNFASAGMYRDPLSDMEVFYADWLDVTEATETTAATAPPQFEILSQVATQNRFFDITRRGAIAERSEILRRCLRSTDLMPLDGNLRSRAERAVGRVKDPLAQAKAIYEWVIENTSYASENAEQPERTPLSAEFTLTDWLNSGDLSAQTHTIALLFVALCRALGIPARPVFGVYIDSSRLFPCLGASGDLSCAQHCRAEFYSPGYGWVPVDPAAVRKAIDVERLSNHDSKLSVLKKLLFGFWEMNWVGFNAAQDINLRGAALNTRPFLTRPVAQSEQGRFDSLNQEHINFQLSAHIGESQ